MKTDPWLRELQRRFAEAGDPAVSEGQMAYMRNQFSFYGLKAPVWVGLFREYVAEAGYPAYGGQLETIVRQAYREEYRELHYIALQIIEKTQKKSGADLVDLLEELIRKNSWWDTVDGIGPNFIGKILLNHCSAEERKKYAVNWNKSSNIWNIRTSIIFQLKYKDKLDFDLACTMILNHIDSKEFFIQKASGWILREYAKTHMTKVKIFVEGHALSNLTKREALKHA